MPTKKLEKKQKEKQCGFVPYLNHLAENLKISFW